MYYGSCTAAAINLKEALPQYMSRSTRGIKSILCTAARVLQQPNLKVASPQYTSRSTRNEQSLMYCRCRSTRGAAVHKRLFFSLMYCGASYTTAAAVCIDAPQLEPFYTVPQKILKLRSRNQLTMTFKNDVTQMSLAGICLL